MTVTSTGFRFQIMVTMGFDLRFSQSGSSEVLGDDDEDNLRVSDPTMGPRESLTVSITTLGSIPIFVLFY